MEENKYFTPEITDFYLGYQYEYQPWDWKNKKYLDKWVNGVYRKEKSLHKIEEKYIVTGHLRTKYLSKEDIEAEGWKFEEVIPGTFGIQKFSIKNNKIKGADFKTWFTLKFDGNYKFKYLQIYNEFRGGFNYTESTDCIFKGECKSVNEFRKIVKWLRI